MKLILYRLQDSVLKPIHNSVARILNHERGWSRAGLVFEEGEPAEVAIVADSDDPYWQALPSGIGWMGFAHCAAFNSRAPYKIDTIVVRYQSFLYNHFILNHELGHVFGLDHTPDGLMGYKQSFPTDKEVEQVREIFAEELTEDASLAPENEDD